MIGKLIRFVLVLAIGAVIGFLSHDSIAEKIQGSKIEETANAAEKATNDFIDEKTDSISAEEHQNPDNFE
jgi:hypothetical protein